MLHKCILILILTIGLHILWIAWKVYIVLNPETWQWINLPLIHSQIIVNSSSTLLIILLIAFCYYAQKKHWGNTIVPHVIINIFISLMLADGFLVGIYSPAMLFSLVCFSGVGLILFNRAVIYYQLAIALFIYAVLIYLTYINAIPYAPIFSRELLASNPYNNQFWLLSMLYFIIPIMVACLILCEILLSQWRLRESLIQVLSQTDPLTNLYNRRFFNEQLDAIQKAQTQYAIILIDIDHFKMINDDYGHHVGDEALRCISNLLSAHVRNTDIVARYGGEEFIVAMPNASLKVAHEVAERCRFAIQELTLNSLDGQPVHLTASFGISISNHEPHMNKIIHHADQALYRAKQYGRNQIQLYQD